MSTEYAGREERLHTAEVFRDKWVWLVLLGGVLIAAGAAAILVPAVSEIAASKVLGSVLIISGILQIMQAAKMLNWIGFIWHMLLRHPRRDRRGADLHGSVCRSHRDHDPDCDHLCLSRRDPGRFCAEGPPPGRMALVPGIGLHRLADASCCW